MKYRVDLVRDDLLLVGFGEAATNADITKEIHLKADKGNFHGGAIIKVNGAASMPAAFCLSHGLSHMYGAIAVFDPKLLGYVVSISHNPEYEVGDVILATQWVVVGDDGEKKALCPDIFASREEAEAVCSEANNSQDEDSLLKFSVLLV